MKLKVSLPTEMLVNEPVTKIIAEAENGLFCLEPRHIDFVAALVSGILSFDNEAGKEVFLGVDEGVLIKRGSDVLVSVRDAVRSPSLEQLKAEVETRFRRLDESERTARSALARLEAGVVRRFMQLQEAR